MCHTLQAHTERYSLEVGARGRLVLPAPVRRHLGLEQGDRLVLTVESDGALRLLGARQQARRLRGLLRYPQSKRQLSEGLITDWREEARREEGARAR